MKKTFAIVALLVMVVSVVSLPLEVGYREAFDNGVVISGSAGVFLAQS